MSQDKRPRSVGPWTSAPSLLAIAGLCSVVAVEASQDDQAPRAHRRPAPVADTGAPSARVGRYKLDGEVQRRRDVSPLSTSSVIVRLAGGAQLPSQFKRFARSGRLDIINGQVLDLPNSVIRQLESHPDVFQVHHNRPAGKFNYRTSVTVGAAAVRSALGYTGRGVGIAVIDSGIASWHDDLTSGNDPTLYAYGNQRV